MCASEVTRLVVNGQEMSFDGKPSIREILDKLDVKTSRVAVELNKKIVRKDEYGKTYPSDGDRIEIVTFVGGG